MSCPIGRSQFWRGTGLRALALGLLSHFLSEIFCGGFATSSPAPHRTAPYLSSLGLARFNLWIFGEELFVELTHFGPVPFRVCDATLYFWRNLLFHWFNSIFEKRDTPVVGLM